MSAYSDRRDNNAEILFCPYCGTRLDKGARFCKNCGREMQKEQESKQEKTEEKKSDDNPEVRKTVYEGKLHKCPNCGEVLQAFVTVCPSCGHEIRDKKASSAVQELSEKLEKINAEEAPVFEGKNSVMKQLFGKDFKDEDEEEDAREEFYEQQDEKKASLIINFSVPNTKEDIIEFLLLAASNIDDNKYSNDIVTKAWASKFEQVYRRAEITMQGQPELEQLKKLFAEKKEEEIKKEKERKKSERNGILLFFLFFGGLLFMVQMIINPKVAIIVLVILVVLAIVVFFLYKNIKKNKEE